MIIWYCSKKKCRHEWQMIGRQRARGQGCPACANRIATTKNCMAATHPELVKEFHPTKNAPLTPYNIKAGTHKKIIWYCSKKKCGHEWQMIGRQRARGQGCPACSRRVATPKNCLATTHPELAKEFHPTRNTQLTPYDVVAGSCKKVWWLCSKCGHEWQTVVVSRKKGSGCPACANRIATPKNCLAATHPELAKEFHPTRNTQLTPYDVVAGSGKKVWWLCSKCGHEWQATVSSRAKGTGCPKCAHKQTWKTRRRNMRNKK